MYCSRAVEEELTAGTLCLPNGARNVTTWETTRTTCKGVAPDVVLDLLLENREPFVTDTCLGLSKILVTRIFRTSSAHVPYAAGTTNAWI